MNEYKNKVFLAGFHKGWDEGVESSRLVHFWCGFGAGYLCMAVYLCMEAVFFIIGGAL